MGRRDNIRKAYVTLQQVKSERTSAGVCVMAVIKMKPTSPGMRGMVKISRDHLHKVSLRTA
jgi:hypothetical protein